MARGLLERLRHMRGPALGEFLERAHIEVSIMEETFERGHQAREKASVLTDAVAAHR